jgi:Leucine-rich repeat (LRR) protein/plastocyanin
MLNYNLAITLVLLLLGIQNVFAASICQTQTEIPEAECNTLVALYNNTDGANWSDSATNNWIKTNTPCSWEGVGCDGNGHVISIYRENKNLTGTLPDLNALTSLKYLGLWENKLSGNIPDLSNLTALESLYLNNNELTGNIPDLSALTSLKDIRLFSNKLSGNIPDLSNLTALETLNLTNNELTGNIPDLSALTSLKYLGLWGNKLSGNIPDLSNLTALETLALANNELTGNIPDLSALTSLKYLDLWGNKLSGNIPDLSNLTALEVITLNNNELTGNIPDLSSLIQLQMIALSNNQLSGNIPDLSKNIPLLYVNLTNNQLSGNIPDLSKLTNLLTLRLNNNQLSGEIPVSLTSLTNLGNLTNDVEFKSPYTTWSFPASYFNENALDLGNNNLTASDPTVISFLNTHDPDWKSTQGSNVPTTNNPPKLETIPNQTIKFGETLQIQLIASDPDGDSLTFSLINAPDSASINNGILTWKANKVGVFSFTVKVTDKTEPAQSDQKTFQVTVNKVPSNLRINPPKVNAKVGDELTFNATGSGNGNYIWSTTGGEVKPLEGETVKYKVTEEGVFYIWVTDGYGFAWSLVDSRPLENAIILIRFAATNLNLSVGEKQQIAVKAYDGNGNAKNIIGDVILESENPEIAQVMQNGQVIARGVGTTNLIASYQDKQAKMQVTVTAASRVLQVEPENIILSEGDSQTVKVYAVNQSGTKSLFNNAQLNIRNATIASIQNNVVTGVKKGSTWLDLVAGELSLSVPVIVRFRPTLAITPSSATIIKGNTVAFSISGGKPPYQIKATNGEVKKGVNNTKFVYKSDTTGTAKVTVIDSLNQQIEASINIHSSLDITPKIARLTSQETVTLQAIGGDDNYFWTTTKGQLSSLTDRRVEYTAPAKTGRYTVTVRDGLGNTKDILILVGEDLLLSQQQLFLEPDDTVELTILGGESPYTVEVDAGNAEIVDSKINYKAPKVAGNYTLTVTDNINNKVSAEIKVALDLLITPLSSRIDAGEELILHAAGGFGEKRWVASKGTLDKTEGETVTWTAPQNFGPTIIYVMDAAGTTAVANLEVASSGFAVTPSVRHVFPNDNANFTAVGGATPYTWTLEQGDYNAVDDETINYQADNIRGSYKIEITDSSGKKAQAQVNVYSTRLFASPKILYINKGETLPITIGGGTGNYTITSQLGKLAQNQLKLEQDQVSITTNYTALKTFEGQDIIHILDTAGNLASIKVEIAKKDDIINIYAGADGKIDEAEMSLAIDDFFAGQAWLDRTIMFEITEQFVGE